MARDSQHDDQDCSPPAAEAVVWSPPAKSVPYIKYGYVHVQVESTGPQMPVEPIPIDKFHSDPGLARADSTQRFAVINDELLEVKVAGREPVRVQFRIRRESHADRVQFGLQEGPAPRRLSDDQGWVRIELSDELDAFEPGQAVSSRPVAGLPEIPAVRVRRKAGLHEAVAISTDGSTLIAFQVEVLTQVSQTTGQRLGATLQLAPNAPIIRAARLTDRMIR